MSARKMSLAEQGLTALNLNWDALFALGIFFAAFALYARTAAPGVLDGDFGEFQTNIYLLGVSHTGYPLYFLLAKLWTLLMPVGDVAYRANVFSGLFGALTLTALYLTLRTLGLPTVVSLGTALVFGVSRVQWSQAVIPDVYTLNSFFIVLVIALAVLWRMGRVPLWALGLAYGFSMTHHRTMIWFAPALLLFVLWGGRRAVFQPRALAKTIAALFLPLLLYAYIPLRGESFVGVEYHPGNNINILALNAMYDLRFGPPGFIWERITQVYLALLVEQFTPVGLGLGLIGVAALALKRAPAGFPAALPPRQFLLLLGLAHLAETAFAIVFWVIDSEIFFIPSYLTFLFFVAVGLGVVYDFLRQSAARFLPARVGAYAGGAVTAALLVALTGYLLWTNFARNDQSRNDEAQVRWETILAQPLESNATLVGPWEDLTPFEYYQKVEHIRPDLKQKKVVLYQDQLALAAQGDVVKQINALVAQGNTVYLTRHPGDTETLTALKESDLVPYVSLWRIQPPPYHGMDQQRQAFGDREELRALTRLPGTVSAGGFLALILNWAPETGLDSMRLVVRVLDATNQVWVAQESLPLGGRPIPAGKKNVRDLQGVLIPPDAPPGSYTLELTAYERDSTNPVSIVGDSNRVTTTLQVLAPTTAADPARVVIPRPLPATFGAAQFLGYDISNPQPSGGDVVELSTWWQNIARADDPFEVRLQDANGVESTLYQGALFPTGTGRFLPLQIVRAHHNLTIPPQAAAGYARLTIALNGQALAPIRIPLAETTRRFRVPIITRPQLTLFGDTHQLLGYKLDRTRYRPGETIPLTLYWETNQTPPASYKVFVHLADANGVVRAQQDAIPRGGTLATNRWFPGEYVTDEYTIALPADLAAGDYHLLVGMYDPATGERVPLRDGSGAPLADNAVVLADGIQVR